MAIKVKETAIPKAFMAVIASLPVLEIPVTDAAKGRRTVHDRDRRTIAIVHAVTSLTWIRDTAGMR